MPFVLLSLQAFLMNWYIAKIVLKITPTSGDETPRFEEQLRLVRASGIAEAFLKGRIIGLAEEDPYFSDHESVVQTEFINVPEVVRVDRLHDTSEVYAGSNAGRDPNAYIRRIHEKAMFIRRCNMALN